MEPIGYSVLAQAIVVFFAGCGAFVLLVNAYRGLKELRKPHDDTAKTVMEHDEKLIHDYEEIGEIKQELRIVLECLMPVMTHLIDGNDVENLKSKRDFLETYLINLIER